MGIGDFCVVYVIGFEMDGVFWAFVAYAVVGSHLERAFGYCDEGVRRAHRGCDLDTCLRLGYNGRWRLWFFRRGSGFVFASGQEGREDDEIEGCAGNGLHIAIRQRMCGRMENQYNVSVPKEKLYAIQMCLTGYSFNSFARRNWSRRAGAIYIDN